jgi:hypothetical protein
MRSTIFTILAMALLTTTAARADLVAHFPFDGDALDATANGNDGTFVGGTEVYVDGFDGTVGGALSFDGADDYLDVTQTVSLPLTANAAFSVAMWVNGDAQNDRRVFSEGSTANGSPLYNIGSDNTGATGALDIFIRRDAGQGTAVGHRKTARDAFDGSWHHIVVVDDNSTMTIYIDGVQEGPSFSYVRDPLTVNTTTLGGILRATPCCLFTGAIDDVRLYDHALNPENVAALVPEPDGCPEDGDTTCDGLSAEGPDGTILEGAWTFTADGVSDTSGDTPQHIFVADGPDGERLYAGPQAADSAVFTLTAGVWEVSCTVDDDFLCRDTLAAAVCSIEVTVVSELPRLVLSLPFDNDLLDATGNGNDGTWNGNADPIFVQGWDCDPVGALSFSGDTGNNPGDDVVIVAQTTGLPVYNSAAFTIAMWVKAETPTTVRDKRIWSEGSTTSNTPLFNLGTSNIADNPGLDFFLRAEGADGGTIAPHLKSTLPVFDGTWHHVCWIDANGDVTLYVDGVEEPVTDFDYTRPPMSFDTTTVGGILRGSTCCELAGAIDDVLVFNYAISEEQVAEICGQDAPPCCPEAGDTHCDGLNLEVAALPLEGGGAEIEAFYEASAFATDDSGDDILFTFEATAEGHDTVTDGPSARSTTILALAVNTVWTVTVTVDDDPDCDDVADDASCSTEVSVPPPCPEEGDTHCTGLDVDGDGSPGSYTATATATDDSGDDVLYTFTAAHPTIDPPTVIGPQTENTATFELIVDGDWLISVDVDDDEECADVADDARCAVAVPVSSGVGAFVRGDVDGSGAPELTDAVYLFNHLFLGGPIPPCRAAADANLEGNYTITSGVYLLNFLFLGGPEPLGPFPVCGNSSEASDVALGCETPTACP